MKKTKILSATALSLLLLTGVSTQALAENTTANATVEASMEASHLKSLSASMAEMQQSINAALKAKDSESFIKDMMAMKVGVERSKDFAPDKLDGDKANSPEMKAYREALQNVAMGIDKSIATAKSGDLKEAKAQAKALFALKQKYHKEYR